MAQTVEELIIAFSAETEKLSRDLKRIETATERSGRRAAKSTNRLKKSLDGVTKSAGRAGGAMIAAFVTGGALRGIKNMTAQMNDLQTAADGLGVSAELIQELRYAFVDAGADAGKVEKVLADFTKRVGEARQNLGTLYPFLAKFGITLKDNNGVMKSTTQLFDEVADKIATMTDSADKAALGNAAFGRSWVDIVAVTNKGSKALADVRKEARETGAVMKNESVAAAAALDVEFNKLALTLSTKVKSGIVDVATALGLFNPEQRKIAELEQRLKDLNEDIAKIDAMREDKGRPNYMANAYDRAKKKAGALSIELAGLQSQLIRMGGSNEPEIDIPVTVTGLDRANKMMEDFVNDIAKDGMKSVDEWIDTLTTEKLPEVNDWLDDLNASAINELAYAFEDLAYNLEDANKIGAQFVRTLGQMILRQLALKAAEKTVSIIPGFADGGVMSSAGPVPLRKYAKGGVANSPQLAMFGEGRLPEAYVPLPDGRTIPVTIKGGGGMGGGGQVVNQYNNFTVDVAREVQAQIAQVAPLLIEASKQATLSEISGVRN